MLNPIYTGENLGTGQEVRRGKVSRSPAFTRNVFDLQVLPALIKSEFRLAF